MHHQLKKKLRNYDETYLQFGFKVTAHQKPQWIVCAEVLANDNVKPSKLKRHLEKKHAEFKGKPAAYFERNLMPSISSTNKINITVSTRCLEASYAMAKRIINLINHIQLPRLSFCRPHRTCEE